MSAGYKCGKTCKCGRLPCACNLPSQDTARTVWPFPGDYLRTELKIGAGAGTGQKGGLVAGTCHIPWDKAPDQLSEHEQNLIEFADKIDSGVFCGFCQVKPAPVDGVEQPWDPTVYGQISTVGTQPTLINATSKRFLIHVFDCPHTQFEGATVRMLCSTFLRPELNFRALSDLQKTIRTDIELSHQILEGDAAHLKGDAFFSRSASETTVDGGFAMSESEEDASSLPSYETDDEIENANNEFPDYAPKT